MKVYYCWRCKADMPFLEESEWVQIEPYLTQYLEDLKNFRKQNNCDLETAKKNVKPISVEIFKKLTGELIKEPSSIRHHRLMDWGPECKNCGQLLRTPNAKFCVICGEKS